MQPTPHRLPLGLFLFLVVLGWTTLVPLPSIRAQSPLIVNVEVGKSASPGHRANAELRGGAEGFGNGQGEQHQRRFRRTGLHRQGRGPGPEGAATRRHRHFRFRVGETAKLRSTGKCGARRHHARAELPFHLDQHRNRQNPARSGRLELRAGQGTFQQRNSQREKFPRLRKRFPNQAFPIPVAKTEPAFFRRKGDRKKPFRNVRPLPEKPGSPCTSSNWNFPRKPTSCL